MYYNTLHTEQEYKYKYLVELFHNFERYLE